MRNWDKPHWRDKALLFYHQNTLTTLIEERSQSEEFVICKQDFQFIVHEFNLLRSAGNTDESPGNSTADISLESTPLA